MPTSDEGSSGEQVITLGDCTGSTRAFGLREFQTEMIGRAEEKIAETARQCPLEIAAARAGGDDNYLGNPERIPPHVSPGEDIDQTVLLALCEKVKEELNKFPGESDLSKPILKKKRMLDYYINARQRLLTQSPENFSPLSYLVVSLLNGNGEGVSYDGYEVKNNHDWITSYKRDVEQTVTRGWKFHVSVPLSHVELAWDVIAPILRKHQVSTFKVLSPESTSRDEFEETTGEQRGKIITIYQYMNPNLAWQSILQEIHHALIDAGIRNGPVIENDHAIKTDSEHKFIYYRNDEEEREVKGSANPEFDGFTLRRENPDNLAIPRDTAAEQAIKSNTLQESIKETLDSHLACKKIKKYETDSETSASIQIFVTQETKPEIVCDCNSKTITAEMDDCSKQDMMGVLYPLLDAAAKAGEKDITIESFPEIFSEQDKKDFIEKVSKQFTVYDNNGMVLGRPTTAVNGGCAVPLR